MGVGFRGAGEGPTALRAMRRSVGSMETMVQWRSELTAVDFGNAPIDNLSVERSMPPIRRMVREIAETGAIPVIIGGDHSIEFANVVGFDLVELNPLVDPGYTTVLNAKQVVDECMTGIALRKLGLGNRDYLSPLTHGDGRR
ncbi:arginase family protein [Candidatus Palauibacter sp.]|uniref:arginase family protein n=1 Tax=Candidatus Palauibacter sp. TaxID=3101350 RepID=UPI003AF21609